MQLILKQILIQQSNLLNYSTLITLRIHRQSTNMKLIEITNQTIAFLEQQEILKWNSLTKFYLNNLNKFTYRLDYIEQFYNVDLFLIWQLIIIRQRFIINKKQDEII
ncbi:unnamed protein product [Paramecium sonneborni]|uniref:Uncharacterized protein n=1 Tax=Paramecium sonneborni TaxID=65129 RepID=A0A8S1RQM8_9CILI|nr:unnamed protein product [Paramecium sonneborni]